MADLGISKGWLVSPTKAIDEMWAKAKIQEQKSKIVRWTQDIEDLQKGRILNLRADIAMAELEITRMEGELKNSQAQESKIVDAEIVSGDNNQGRQRP